MERNTLPIALIFVAMIGLISPALAFQESWTVCSSGCNYTTLEEAIAGYNLGESDCSDYCFNLTEPVNRLDEFYVDCFAYDYNCSEAQTLTYYLADQQGLCEAWLWLENEYGGFGTNIGYNMTTLGSWNFNEGVEIGYRYITINPDVLTVLNETEASGGAYIYLYNANLNATEEMIVYKDWEVCSVADCGGRGNDSTELTFETDGNGFSTYAVGEAYIEGDDICDTDNWEQMFDSPDCEGGVTGFSIASAGTLIGAMVGLFLLGVLVTLFSVEDTETRLKVMLTLLILVIMVIIIYNLIATW